MLHHSTPTHYSAVSHCRVCILLIVKLYKYRVSYRGELSLFLNLRMIKTNIMAV